MKLLQSLLEMNRDEAETEARNMYGSLNHKAHSGANDLQRSHDSDDDGYSAKEWAQDWCNDHKQAVQTVLQLLQQDGREEEAAKVISDADRGLEDYHVDQLFDEIF